MKPQAEKDRLNLAAGRREIREVLQTCQAIEDRKFNPFLLDVGRAITILRKYFNNWEIFKDLCLDAQAINKLSRVIRLQNSQLRFQSGSLYADQDLIQRKVESLSSRRLAEIFVGSWHPIVELEQLTPSTMKAALGYWSMLLPYEERRKRLTIAGAITPSPISQNEILRAGFAAKEEFSKHLEGVWEEVKAKSLKKKMVEYWSFISQKSYAETVGKAYLVSFLVTYGYASLIRKGRKMYLKPNETPKPRAVEGVVSFPISITPERWREVS